MQHTDNTTQPTYKRGDRVKVNANALVYKRHHRLNTKAEPRLQTVHETIGNVGTVLGVFGERVLVLVGIGSQQSTGQPRPTIAHKFAIEDLELFAAGEIFNPQP